MHLYGHMICQAHICPGKCHEDKTLHILLEIIGTKYDVTYSYPLRAVDFKIFPLRYRSYILDSHAPRVKDTADLF